MKAFKKLIDLATNQYENYQDENEVYIRAINEIDAIGNLLSLFTKIDGIDEYYDEYSESLLHLEKVKDTIILLKRRLKDCQNIDKYKALEEKIRLLHLKYERLLEDLKNNLLSDKEILDIQNHIRELSIIINTNARYEAFQGYINKLEWTLKDLETLRNKMASRRVEIIPYISTMRR